MSSILAPIAEETRGAEVGDWHPARFTVSLSGTEDFTTEGDKLLAFADRHWSIADTATLELDEWQRWLIRHLLETYPPDWPVIHLRGRLRFRQAVVSIGRQNGKSLLASLLAIYFLVLHVRGPRVLGLASIDRQAKIVYNRVKYAVENSDALAREIRTTATRGISRRDGSGLYQTLPADEDAAQGEPVTGGIYDELHLGLAALWDALVLGQRAHANSMLAGLTTAGNDESLLLKRLYQDGETAIAGGDERFGFFVWEADDDELTVAGIVAANPSIACGRNSLEIALADAEKMWTRPYDKETGMTGRQRVIRYTLNRFVEGASSAWASLPAWRELATDDDLIDRATDRVVFGLHRTPSWEYASIVAVSTAGTERRVELVASIVDPSLELLLGACRLLRDSSPAGCGFAVEAGTLKDLGDRLREEGATVYKLATGEAQAAAQSTHAAIARRAIAHNGEQLLRVQMSHAKRRDTGDGWRLSTALSLGPIDAVRAMVAACYATDLEPEPETQIF